MNQQHATPKKVLKPFYRTPVVTNVILLLVLTAGAVMTAAAPGFLSTILCAVCTAGLFAFYYILTFQPAAVLVVFPAYLIAFLLTGSLITAGNVLLFLPMGAVLSLCMLKRSGKTTAVIAVSAALGISVIVLFLIQYIMANGTISPDALKASYTAFFEQLRTEMTLTASSAAAATQNEMLTEAAIQSMVDLTVDAMKLAMPSVFAVAAQILGYLCISVYLLLTKLLRCHLLVPKQYRITVSRSAAVIFMIAYLINIFPIGSTVSMMQIACANLATVIMPGLFVMGLNSLRRRAKNPLRRRSFVITVVIIGLMLFTYPSFAVFFIIVDGIGEVFFQGRSLF